MMMLNDILPSLSTPLSAAWPTGKMVLTKMPMLPLGESIPPTTLNPSPFLPGPFSNMTVCRDMDSDLGLGGIWCLDDDLLTTWG